MLEVNGIAYCFQLDAEEAVKQLQKELKQKLEDITHIRAGYEKRAKDQAAEIANYKAMKEGVEIRVSDQAAEIEQLRERFAIELQQDAVDELNKTGRSAPYGMEGI